MASALVFIYPRHLPLIKDYINNFMQGTLSQVLVLSHRDDQLSVEHFLGEVSGHIDLYVNVAFLPDYEFLLAASFTPRDLVPS